MIVGIGMDLVEVRRVADVIERRGERALRRLFTPDEIAYCQGGGRAAAMRSFAARFAAKEAFFKALGTGCGAAGAWAEVGVARDAAGAPSLTLSGAASRSAEARGVNHIHLSLTHTDELAGAYVVLER
jgi:holo-[acyl-carrier protein] synthase